VTARYRLGSGRRYPNEPGIYTVFSGGTLGDLGFDPQSGPIYIGKAADSLARRIGREHQGDTGRSTLRRSIAALLKHELDLRCIPRPSRGDPKPINFTNFSLEARSDRTLTNWMETNLEFELEAHSDPATRETILLSTVCPPLNLNGCSNEFQNSIKSLRAECAAEARARWESR